MNRNNQGPNNQNYNNQNYNNQNYDNTQYNNQGYDQQYQNTQYQNFDKQSNLKNGDKVEVTISLNKNTVNKLKLKTTGEFKRTFTVNGLNEKAKEKETIIVKESSSKPSASSSSSSSGSRRSDERTVYVRPSAGVNLRSSSNDSSSIITPIPVGRSVYQHYIEVNSEGEAWAYVSYGGSNGWIRADLIG